MHTDGKEINDIDVLIDGTDAYGDIINLAGNVVRPEAFPLFVATHGIKRAVAMRRGQLSQFRLSQYSDTVVDIRLVRGDQDSREISMLLKGAQLGETVSMAGATVVDAQESLSVPACFKVQVSDGKVWSIVTNQYHHLGAAGEGDVVAVRGRVSGERAVVLTDPDRHHIYMPALS